MHAHTPITDSASSSVPEDPGTGPTCPKCGIIPGTGKRSCCADGGAWLDDCGVVGDSRFEHTWNEGIQACRRSANLLSKVAELQIRRRDKTTQTHSNLQQSSSQKKIVESIVESTTDADIASSEAREQLSNILGVVTLVFIIVCSQMQ